MTTGPPWQVEFYTTESGRSPVEKFINALPIREQGNIRNFIRLLRKYGTDLEMPKARSLTKHKPLWELRPLPYRLIYFLHTERTFIILHAFVKKRNTTEKRHIETAKRRKFEFLEREG